MPHSRPLRTLASLSLLLLLGCKHGWNDTGEDDGGPVRTRSYDYAASSMLLYADGSSAVIATTDGIVAFETATGDATSTTPSEDFVQPKLEDWVGTKVAIIDRDVDGGVYLWRPGEQGYELHEDEEAEANASHARGFEGGLAWIGRRGNSCRIFREGLALTSIEDCGSLHGLAIAPEDGTLFMGYDDGEGGQKVRRVDPGGELTELQLPLDLLSWDDPRETLYAATEGGSTVQAVTIDGGPVFNVQLEATITDLVALEEADLLAVLASSGSDTHIHLIDQYSGEQVATIDAASAANALIASADGGTLALPQADRMAILTVDWDALLAAAADTGE
jgi:hypothetical protein